MFYFYKYYVLSRFKQVLFIIIIICLYFVMVIFTCSEKLKQVYH